jgi:hypothetical protein
MTFESLAVGRRRVTLPDDIRGVPVLIGQLFQIVQLLNKIFPDRPFTLDGHLVGSIGEVVAAYTYGLELEKCSNEGFDAKTEDGRTVEIKLTGGNSVSVSSEGQPPDLLVVLQLKKTVGFTEVHNGPFPTDLWRRKTASKRRVKALTINELKALNQSLLPQEHPLEELNKLFVATDGPSHDPPSFVA